MSIVSGVTLQVSVSEDVALIDEINAWLAQRAFGPLKRLEDAYGGNKRPQVIVVGGGYNLFPEDEFIELVMRLPWRTPECVVLLVNPEEGPTKVYRADALMSDMRLKASLTRVEEYLNSDDATKVTHISFTPGKLSDVAIDGPIDIQKIIRIAIEAAEDNA